MADTKLPVLRDLITAIVSSMVLFSLFSENHRKNMLKQLIVEVNLDPQKREWLRGRIYRYLHQNQLELLVKCDEFYI